MSAMPFRATAAWAVPLLPLSLLLTGCGSDNSLQPGTPPFYWAAAQQTWTAGDYSKTIDNLEKLTDSNEYKTRAIPWLLVATSGLQRGYMDLADNFEAGTRANKSDPIRLRRYMSQSRSNANRLALQFAETFALFQKGTDENATLAFSFPGGSAVPAPQLRQVANGVLIPEAEVETLQKRTLERGVVLAAAKAAGVPDDPAQALAKFKAGNAQTPRADFIAAMAGTLFDQSGIYARNKLDEPEKLRLFRTRALDALKTVPDNKQAKELSQKIETAMKKKT